MGGKGLNLEDNNEILNIKSPENRVDGPYIVVAKDIKDRWAIVAMTWDDNPRLGIRWFHGSEGTPVSSSHPIWLVVPPLLNKGILSGLAPEREFSSNVGKFLAGDLSGTELKLTQHNA